MTRFRIEDRRCRAMLVGLLALCLGLPSVWALSAGEKGAVHMVGMGPGDPELVTFKAARILKEADCVFCFEYLKGEVARFAAAEKIRVASPLLMGRYRGERFKDPPPELLKRMRRSDEEAARFLPEVRRLIAGGKRVVFAAAGDPTVYCPWSWILADLQPKVVPGLSSFNAANAALGQSITRNGGSVLLSVGDDLGVADEHGRLKPMLVLFTHRAKLKEVLPRLQGRYPADTPIAIVAEASYERQRVVFATLGTIQEKLSNRELPHLYLIYVGDGLTASKAAGRASDAAPR